MVKPRCPALALALSALLLLCPAAHADLRPVAPPVLDLTASSRIIDLAAPEGLSIVMIVEPGPGRNLSLGAIIAQAALSSGVPESFLLRLLTRESRLNPQAVSVKGAQGIAQFMPTTAAEMGLDDPFDPAKAIPKAAELLRNLRARYGNWGLAAAAYNAGPGRVDSWLLGRSPLPTETVAYVASITGIDVATWADGKRPLGLGWPLQGALGSPWGGSEGDGRLHLLPGLRGISLTTPTVAAGHGALAHTARASSRSSGRVPLVPRDPTGPCAALLETSSRCLAFTRY